MSEAGWWDFVWWPLGASGVSKTSHHLRHPLGAYFQMWKNLEQQSIDKLAHVGVNHVHLLE
jgi:hypothetical protein